MNRYFAKVTYDGTDFHGSQIQGDLPTVQSELNNALSTIMRRPVETYGASRTDEGVHALHNIYHFDAENIDLTDVRYKMNAITPKSLAILEIRQVIDPNANCRFDALKRRYRYKVHFSKNPFLLKSSYFLPLKLDPTILNETAAMLMQYSDFETFSKRNTKSRTSICIIYESYWIIKEDGLEYVVCANRFLRGMVRALVGTQLNVARGRFDIQDFERRIKAKDCSLADFSVPGHGLYLEEIQYPSDYFVEE